MKVKVFDEMHEKDLEKSVNDFLDELDESFLIILSNFVDISSNISNLVLIESNFSLFAETVSYNLSISC